MTRKFVKRSKFFAHVLSTLTLFGIKGNENSFVLENLAELSIKIPQSDWSFGLFWKISQNCQSKCYNLIGRLENHPILIDHTFPYSKLTREDNNSYFLYESVAMKIAVL